MELVAKWPDDVAEVQWQFRKLNKIWHYRKLGLPIKIWLYTSTVKAILLHGAETWPLTRTERLSVWRLHITNGWEGSWTYCGRIWSVMRRSWRCQSRNVGWDGWGTCKGSSDDKIAKQVLHWIPEERENEVDRTSPGNVWSSNTLRREDCHGRKHYHWLQTEESGGIVSPNMLATEGFVPILARENASGFKQIISNIAPTRGDIWAKDIVIQ